MREIKFRAWEKTLNEMIPVNNIDFIKQSINTDSTWRFLPEIELMQYTGLKDMNGVEIYEGDVLEYYDLRKGVFIFKEQPKRREAIRWSQNDAQYRIPDMGFRLDTDKVEVIGNIYENPELLEVTE